MLQQASQGLASLGRNGDSMLVHMNPKEVAGLQGLAMAQGGSLTVNPHTGMPEAFSLRNLFTSLLPTAVGALVGGPLGAGAVGGLLGGAATGAAIAKSKGEDPLMGGLMGGLGGYGGAGIADAFKAAGASTVGNAANAANAANTGAIANVGGGTGNVGMFTASPNLGATGATSFGNTTGNIGMANTFGTTADSSKMLGDTLGLKANDVSLINTGGGFDPAKAASDAAANSFGGQMSQMGTGAKNLLGFGDAPGTQAAAYEAASAATPNFGTKLALTGGQGVLSGLEPSDLYGDPINIGDKNKYDPYARLNLNNNTGLRLLAEGGQIKNYAIGGTVPNPSAGGGLSDLYNRPEGATNQSLSNDGYGMGRLDNLAGQQSKEQAKTFGYADGGDVAAGDKGMNLDALPTLNLNTGISSLGGMGGDALYTVNNPVGKMLLSKMSQSDRAKFINSGVGTFFGLQERPKQEYYTSSGALTSSYAQGGYLDGAGDGMSDSIPATIEGKQPARLADGEFVVPADVVSHLGNGSSKAGSKRLYAMLDKVRHARTGNKKQGKEINPNKYMPA